MGSIPLLYWLNFSQGWAGTLLFRHTRLFKGYADIWELVLSAGTAGGTAAVYSLNTTNVPYVLDRKSAVEQPWVLGAIESEDMITTDTMRFPPGTELRSAWIVVDRSITITGAESSNYNQGWACKGDPVHDDHLDDVRRAGMVEAYVTRLSIMPAAIEAFYA